MWPFARLNQSGFALLLAKGIAFYVIFPSTIPLLPPPPPFSGSPFRSTTAISFRAHFLYIPLLIVLRNHGGRKREKYEVLNPRCVARRFGSASKERSFKDRLTFPPLVSFPSSFSPYSSPFHRSFFNAPYADVLLCRVLGINVPAWPPQSCSLFSFPATADSVASPTLKSATQTFSILHLWNFTLYCEEEMEFIKFYFQASLSLSRVLFLKYSSEELCVLSSVTSCVKLLKTKTPLHFFS